MDEKKAKVDRQTKDKKLKTLETDINMEVSKNLREKYTSWSNGRPKKETSRTALTEAIQNDLGITISDQTVKAHLSGTYKSKVSLPILCWYANKFDTSVNFLLTGSDDAPKASSTEKGAGVTEVLDALRVILTAFPSQTVLEKYEEQATTYNNGVLSSVPKTYYAIRLNSAAIQEQLANLDVLNDILKKENVKPHKDLLTERLFLEPLEKSKEKYDAISNTGVLYKSEDEPAFVRFPDSNVSAAVPFFDLGIFSQEYEYRGYEEYFGRHEYAAIPNKLRKCQFDEDSNYTLKDVDEIYPEPDGYTDYDEEDLPLPF